LKLSIWAQTPDTTAIVTGSLAGAAYPDELPLEWVNALVKIDFIKSLCDSFAGAVKGSE